METTKRKTMNMYTLARKAYGVSKYDRNPLVRCIIEDVPMISYNGHHAEIELPDYQFISRLGYRNGQRATDRLPELKYASEYFDVKVQKHLEVPNIYTDRIDQDILLSNGAKIQADYYHYYKAKYPDMVMQHTWVTYDPIKIYNDDKLVAVIMPLRKDK